MITDFARTPFCALQPLGINAASVGLGSKEGEGFQTWQTILHLEYYAPNARLDRVREGIMPLAPSSPYRPHYCAKPVSHPHGRPKRPA
jgi:hypothetical protein